MKDLEGSLPLGEIKIRLGLQALTGPARDQSMAEAKEVKAWQHSGFQNQPLQEKKMKACLTVGFPLMKWRHRGLT